MKHFMQQQKQNGLTLLELLVYLGVLAVLIVALFGFISWVYQTNGKFLMLKEVNDNLRRAMDIMSYEIREAKALYVSTSNSQQISLESFHSVPLDETFGFIDFFICGKGLCLKEETLSPIVLTSDRVEVKNLFFEYIATTSTAPSVQISLTLGYLNVAGQTEPDTSASAVSVVSLRR